MSDQEREALKRLLAVTELPGTRTEIAPEMERAKSFAYAALAVREEPQACTCRHPPEGVIGWDRGMVDRECPVHGHEALPERRDPQMEKVVEAMRAMGEQEAWNDWYPKSPPSKRNAHRHGFNAGQAAGAAAREDTERPDRARLEGALRSVSLAYHEVTHGVGFGTESFNDCREVMCVNVRQLLRDTEQEPRR